MQHDKNRIESLDSKTPRQLFKTFKSLNGNKITAIPALSYKDPITGMERMAESDIDKSNLMVECYSSPPQSTSNPMTNHYNEVEDYIKSLDKDIELKEETNDKEELHQQAITREEVIESLRHIEKWKAIGPDDIHNEMLKNGGETLVNSLLYLFNSCLKAGYFPKQWRQSNLIAIPKPFKNHSKCSNLRPIALLSCVGKLLERIVSKRLMWYLAKHKLLIPEQAGFQSFHNTEELLLRITEQICHSIHHNSVTYAVFLDIKGAYDTVWRDGLRYKMRTQFNIKGKLFWLIDSFLSQRKGSVLLNGSVSMIDTNTCSIHNC